MQRRRYRSRAGLPKIKPAFDAWHAPLLVQAGLVPVLETALKAVGLLDPISAETGFRVSEEVVFIRPFLGSVMPTKASYLAPPAPPSHGHEATIVPARTLTSVQ